MNAEIVRWLEAFVADFGGVAGSVHHLRGDLLVMTAAHRLPEPVIRATATIPRGKGMAGLAWERDTPIQTCNLKTDTSGAVKPGARAVDAQAAVALPVHGEGGAVRAVVGVAFAREGDLGEAELARLVAAAAALPDA